jgi:hypothetical protein
MGPISDFRKDVAEFGVAQVAAAAMRREHRGEEPIKTEEMRVQFRK